MIRTRNIYGACYVPSSDLLGAGYVTREQLNDLFSLDPDVVQIRDYHKAILFLIKDSISDPNPAIPSLPLMPPSSIIENIRLKPQVSVRHNVSMSLPLETKQAIQEEMKSRNKMNELSVRISPRIRICPSPPPASFPTSCPSSSIRDLVIPDSQHDIPLSQSPTQSLSQSPPPSQSPSQYTITRRSASLPFSRAPMFSPLPLTQ